MDISNFAQGLKKFGLGSGKTKKRDITSALKSKKLNEFSESDLEKGINPDMAGDLNPKIEAPEQELQSVAKPEINPMEDPEEKRRKRFQYLA